jgi:hypothetical protein
MFGQQKSREVPGVKKSIGKPSSSDAWNPPCRWTTVLGTPKPLWLAGRSLKNRTTLGWPMRAWNVGPGVMPLYPQMRLSGSSGWKLCGRSWMWTL